jgi:hypothetical protein
VSPAGTWSRRTKPAGSWYTAEAGLPSPLSATSYSAGRSHKEILTYDDRAASDALDGIGETLDDLGEFDLVFASPSYYTLERYSGDPRGLSAAETPEVFLVAYRRLISGSVARLREGRFAVFVVAPVRLSDGTYLDLVGETVRAFSDAGAKLYNEAALVTPLGAVPIRAARLFRSHRKFGRTHQTVLVFYRGDPSRIAVDFPRLGDLEYGEPDGEQAEGLET